jgi:hypothetical protein
MSDQGGELVRNQTMGVALAEANAAIEPLIAGGIVESAAGPVALSMDGLVQAHITDVAIRTASGDTKSERPAYIFNPASNLLIKFSFHREGPNTSYHGLFADVAELDSEGKARYGVSSPDIRTAFDSSQGFIPVNVGEGNDFTPSSVPLKFEKVDGDDEEEISFPNMELATLADLLETESIEKDVSLEDFLAANNEKYVKTGARVQQRLSSNHLQNDQAISETTNPNLHLIVTDRKDTSLIADISREIGIFPIVLSPDDIVAAVKHIKSVPGASPDRLNAIVPLGDEFSIVRKALTRYTPGFMTIDFPSLTWQEDANGVRTHVRDPAINILGGLASEGAPRTQSGIFRKMVNFRWALEEDDPAAIRKVAHGCYEMPLDPSINANVTAFEDWLRKAKLDFALTQYLRGVDKL